MRGIAKRASNEDEAPTQNDEYNGISPGDFLVFKIQDIEDDRADEGKFGRGGGGNLETRTLKTMRGAIQILARRRRRKQAYTNAGYATL